MKFLLFIIMIFSYLPAIASACDEEVKEEGILLELAPIHGTLFVINEPLEYDIQGDSCGVSVQVGYRIRLDEISPKARRMSNNKRVALPVPYLQIPHGRVPLEFVRFAEGKVLPLNVAGKVLWLACTHQGHLNKQSFTDRITELTENFMREPHYLKKHELRLLESAVIMKDAKSGRMQHGPLGCKVKKALKAGSNIEPIRLPKEHR